jgi:VanZ like family
VSDHHSDTQRFSPQGKARRSRSWGPDAISSSKSGIAIIRNRPTYFAAAADLRGNSENRSTRNPSLSDAYENKTMFITIRLLAAHLRWRSNPIVVLLVLSGLFILYGTLLPFQFSVNGEYVEASLRRIWEHPWHIGSRADLVSNVLLFMPWGFLLATWRSTCGSGFLAAMVLALLSGFLLSGAVEYAQLFTPRSSFGPLRTSPRPAHRTFARSGLCRSGHTMSEPTRRPWAT